MSDIPKEEIRDAVIEFFVQAFDIHVTDDNAGLKIDAELLEAKNEGLRRQNASIDAEILEKLEELEVTNTSIKTQKKIATELKAANENFTRATRSELQAEFNKKVAITIEELKRREKEVAEREYDAKLLSDKLALRSEELAQERKELTGMAKLQQEQTDELQRATKALSIKATDHRHNVETNDRRTADLDSRELVIAGKEAELAQREASVKEREDENASTQRKLKNWHDKLDMTEKSQEKVQESFKDREKKLSDRERAINDRIAVKKLR